MIESERNHDGRESSESARLTQLSRKLDLVRRLQDQPDSKLQELINKSQLAITPEELRKLLTLAQKMSQPSSNEEPLSAPDAYQDILTSDPALLKDLAEQELIPPEIADKQDVMRKAHEKAAKQFIETRSKRKNLGGLFKVLGGGLAGAMLGSKSVRSPASETTTRDPDGRQEKGEYFKEIPLERWTTEIQELIFNLQRPTATNTENAEAQSALSLLSLCQPFLTSHAAQLYQIGEEYFYVVNVAAGKSSLIQDEGTSPLAREFAITASVNPQQPNKSGLIIETRRDGRERAPEEIDASYFNTSIYYFSDVPPLINYKGEQSEGGKDLASNSLNPEELDTFYEELYNGRIAPRKLKLRFPRHEDTET